MHAQLEVMALMVKSKQRASKSATVPTWNCSAIRSWGSAGGSGGGGSSSSLGMTVVP